MVGWRSVGKTTKTVLRRGAKTFVANALELSGGRHLLSTLRRHGQGGPRVQILAWHRVVPDFERMRRRVIPGLLTSTETFEAQLRWLQGRFRIIPLEDALEVLAGRSRSDRDVCVLTFDDGYADFWSDAVPILEKLRMPAMMYVPTGYVEGGVPLLHDRLYRLLRIASRDELRLGELRGDPRMEAALAGMEGRGDEIWVLERLLETQPREVCLMVAEALEERLGEDPAAGLEDSRLLSWDELRAMRKAGFSVGAHTVDHACLHNESPTEVVRQLRLSQLAFERELGEKVRHFAYPNGWYSRGVIRALIREGYLSATTTEDRANLPGDSPFTLKRKCVWEYTSRGLWSFSPAVNAVNFDDILGFLGIAPWVPGEKPDAMRSEAFSLGSEPGPDDDGQASAGGTVA